MKSDHTRRTSLWAGMHRLFAQPRRVKQGILIAFDLLAMLLAYWGAFALRLNTLFVPLSDVTWWLAYLSFAILSVIIAIKMGLYSTIVHYMTGKALVPAIKCAVFSSILVYLCSLAFGIATPHSIPVLYMAFLLVLIGGNRYIIYLLYYRLTEIPSVEQVLVYGAGTCGRQLVKLLLAKRELIPVAFVDDNPKLQGMIMTGLRVYAPSQLPEVIERYDISKILLAIPSAPRSRRRDILNTLQTYRAAVLSVPPLNELATGKLSAPNLEEVSVADLLGRDPVQPLESVLYSSTKNKSVLVTGAGGSIGSELCRQIATHQPRRLVLFEMSEAALYTVTRQVKQAAPSVEIIPILGTVRDRALLDRVFASFGVQTVYHAAAYKHVPLVEYNVIQSLRNNVFGTLNAAQAAIDCGVERFVLISTDKAVRPTNVMGTTKRVAELILQALSTTQSKTCFSMVRFGNVLGSSGSVVPLFRAQIAAGGPVTITHPDIIRYFMTIPEAVELVLQAGGMARGGEVFVLDMGKPVKILDMARELILLSGKSIRDEEHPGGDIAIHFVGLRPGEKLYEELLVDKDAEPTLHPRILCQKEHSLPHEVLKEKLAHLDRACEQNNVEEVLHILSDQHTAYTPAEHSICDLQWQAENSGLHGRVLNVAV